MTSERLDSIGPYKLLEPLGRGGMGVVYRAVHGASGQAVALKTVRAPSPEMLKGLRREIHHLARLRHPGIVRILDEGLHKGMPWYAMELLVGEPLSHYRAELCGDVPTTTQFAAGEATQRWWTRSLAAGIEIEPSREEPLEPGRVGRSGAEALASRDAEVHHTVPLKVALSLTRRLCEALSFLHGEGLVHRDLKPENILIEGASARTATEQPGSMKPVLVDFGLAARFAGAASREALEVERNASGTLAYIAPEVLRQEVVDARADLYSLGCILYELLTGRKPFVASKATDLVRAHLHDTVLPPSHLVPDLPEALEVLVLRLLAKQPRERFGYADDVVSALIPLGAGDDGAFGPQPQAYLYRAEIAGREEPLKALEARLDKLPTGAGGVLLLGGESGVGKTRLLMELGRRTARRNLCVLEGECIPAGLGEAGVSEARAAALHPLRRSLQAIADRCRSRGTAETDRLLGPRARLLGPYEPSLAALPGQEKYPKPEELRGAAAQPRLYAALTSTFAALAKVQPLLLVLDDLQWADELTLGWLEHLLQTKRLRSMPMLIAATYRSEERTPLLERLVQNDEAGLMKLERLEQEAVGQIVSDMLALVSQPKEFIRFLTHQSEGNPFFVAEYLRVAIAERVLFRSKGLWQVAQEGPGLATQGLYETLPLPKSLREMVERRLVTLSRESQRLAHAAAVLGREMDESTLLAVVQLDVEQSLEALEELRVREVLEESSAGWLRFGHDKLREVAYERLDPELRRTLHRSAAEALEVAFAKNEEPVYASLALHWEQGGEPQRARPCHLSAARQDRDRHAWSEAEAHYRAYLRLSPELSAETARARMELGEDVLVARGEMPQALQEQCEALEQARTLGERQLEGQILGYLGDLYQVTGQVNRARPMLEQALGIHRELGNRRFEGNALCSLAILDYEEGRIAEAWALYGEALAIHREVGNRRGEAGVLNGMAIVQREQARFEDARLLYEEALAIHRATGNQRGEANVLNGLAVLHSDQGRLDEARALFEQSSSILRQVGSLQIEGNVLSNLAIVNQEQGRFDEAQALCQRAIEIHRQVGSLRFEGNVLSTLANLVREQGRLDEATILYEQALDLHRQVGNRRSEGVVLSDLAASHYEQGRIEAAQPLFQEALALLRQIGAPNEEALVLCSFATFLRRAFGQLDDARKLILEADQLIPQTRKKVHLALRACEKGHLALAGGQGAQVFLEEIKQLTIPLSVLPESAVAKASLRLARAQEAFDAGQPLFRGERLDDIPEGLRRWLRETGSVGDGRRSPQHLG